MIFFRIFDKDDDGKLSVPELKKIMSSLGEKMVGRSVGHVVIIIYGSISVTDLLPVVCSYEKINHKNDLLTVISTTLF